MRRVLVVEDEAAVRRVIVSSLETLGYVVESAKDGLCALKKLEKHKFDLVVTDLQMPRMDGIKLAATLAREKRDLPILFLTGAPGELPPKPPYDLLQKPFRLAELRDAVKAKLPPLH